MTSLLEISGLQVHFDSYGGKTRAVDSVSLAIDPGEVVGLVGESGCGKSVTALSIIGLLPVPPARIAGGKIYYRPADADLLTLTSRARNRIRGREISMIFQEPMSALNPVLSCGIQIEEVLRVHLGMTAAESKSETIRLLEEVKIPDAARTAARYPHELSGGMRQRVLLAAALAGNPRLLLADEPTTALDVTIQAQILDLILERQRDRGMAVLLISHDLGVIARTASRVAVMYAGQVVEEGPVRQILETPRHPYTEALLGAIPDPDHPERTPLPIPGTLPDPTATLSGCRFEPRCPRAIGRCSKEDQHLEKIRGKAGGALRCSVSIARGGPGDGKE